MRLLLIDDLLDSQPEILQRVAAGEQPDCLLVCQLESPLGVATDVLLEERVPLAIDEFLRRVDELLPVEESPVAGEAARRPAPVTGRI
jgi:hypothetical protein